MANSLNLSLTKELRKFVDNRAGVDGVFSTPSEYIRDLIRHDMESQKILVHVMQGLNDLKNRKFSDKSILDIAEEK